MSQQLVTAYRPLARFDSSLSPELAKALLNVGHILSELDRHADALAVDREAVDLYRNVDATDLHAVRGDLADALSKLAIDLDHLDRHSEAEAVKREAATLNADSA